MAPRMPDIAGLKSNSSLITCLDKTVHSNRGNEFLQSSAGQLPSFEDDWNDGTRCRHVSTVRTSAGAVMGGR